MNQQWPRNGTSQQWLTPEQARPDATSITMPKHPGAQSTARCSQSINAVTLIVDVMAIEQGDSGVGSNVGPILRLEPACQSRLLCHKALMAKLAAHQ